jgi:hypothetical protein
MVSLSNGKGKSQDMLFVDGLKHNLLSVSQVCDRGCEVVFTSKDCRIKSMNSVYVDELYTPEYETNPVIVEEEKKPTQEAGLMEEDPKRTESDNSRGQGK